jgi:uncharacterized repeat protein (TIGR03803 family)
MLEWGNAAFETLGPANARGLEARPTAMGLIEYAFTKIAPADLKAQSWARSAFEAARRGEITENEARGLILDYVAPSLDTTIFAITNAIWLFANNPDQWDLVRENPTLIPSAINEVLRVESPIQSFSRYVTRDAEVGGISIPAGSRAIVVYGSVNRDFYGTTYQGGMSGLGTVFKITPSGAETVLYSFAGSSDRANPSANLVQGSDGTLYGSTGAGGTKGFGTFFKVALQ